MKSLVLKYFVKRTSANKKELSQETEEIMINVGQYEDTMFKKEKLVRGLLKTIETRDEAILDIGEQVESQEEEIARLQEELSQLNYNTLPE